MHFYTTSEIDQSLDYPSLIEALRKGFATDYHVPPRMHVSYENPEDGSENTMLLMPAISVGDVSGVKIVNVAPGNSKKGLESIQGIYYLMDSVTGQPLALFDAKSLTNWRTAAASALAASFLSNPESSCLLMIGTGALAPYLIAAHRAIRPLTRLLVYGRDTNKAQRLASQFESSFDSAAAVDHLEEAMAEAQIISAATSSNDPLIKGEWLVPGQHIDLVGAYKPDTRESDDEVISRSRVFVDTLEMAPKEGGDIAIPLAKGLISLDDIWGDLFQLCRGHVQGRKDAKDITLFKSVGHALEDLVAAKLIISGQNRK